ncbi:MAG: ABC transporter ATP-binding protein, partial [Kofleriaceae bacterium]
MAVLAGLTGIAKAYGRRCALAGVTLDVAAGEVVLLVGRNGAGKTTLLRIATGFLDPDSGTVAIGGLAMASQRAKAQAQLGYLPEHAPAPPELTVREHLRLRARQKGVHDWDCAMEAAAVASEADRRIGTLSKGFRQRVGLADALLGEPPLLVLDEPTSGM